MFFIVVYIHTFRGLYYGSYLYPKEHLLGDRCAYFIVDDSNSFFRICVTVGANVILGGLQLLLISFRLFRLLETISLFGCGVVIP
jgi:hypothetical protein